MHETEAAASVASLIPSVINLAILLGVLYHYTRKPLAAFVLTRHDSLRDELKRVRDQLKAAQEKFDEFSAKLKAIDAEIAALRAQSRQDAQAMKQRVVAEAQRASAMIVTDARAAAEGLYSELRGQLYLDMLASVVDRAERLMRDRLTSDDRTRIRQEFSKQVEAVQ
jgi:F0F1-type ATP synthase membrane subunit b/b'